MQVIPFLFGTCFDEATTKPKKEIYVLEPKKNLDFKCDLAEQYYTTRELSGLLSLSMNTLADYRRKGIGPKYISVGYRSCRYAKSEVLKYIEERTRESTSATENYNLQKGQ